MTLKKPIYYNFIDAWILNSIYNSEKDNLGSELNNIIAYADYVNHSIVELSELNDSIEKLYENQLVEILNNGNLCATEVYKNWIYKKLDNKTRFQILKMVEDTQKFLNTINQEISYSNKEITIKESDYRIALEKYLNKFADK